MIYCDDLTLVISSCDAYADLWENHILLLNEYWGDRCIDTVIVSDLQRDNNNSDINIFAPESIMEMPQRLLRYLRTCKTNYILLSLDDYYLDRKVDNRSIIRIIDYMKEEDIDYYRFWKYPHESKKNKLKHNLFKIELEGSYKVNLYPAIWKKEFLMQTLQNSLNIWDFEVSLTKQAKQLNAKCVYSTEGEFHIVDVIRKGKLLRPAKHFLKSKGLYSERDLIPIMMELKLLLLYHIKEFIPKRCIRFIKRILIRNGYIFYSKDL